jgi:hypothetical protein
MDVPIVADLLPAEFGSPPPEPDILVSRKFRTPTTSDIERPLWLPRMRAKALAKNTRCGAIMSIQTNASLFRTMPIGGVILT